MNQAKRLPTRVRLAVAIAVCALTAPASAQPTSDRPASIIIFPKVVANGEYDTTIQITNVSDTERHARCLYSNAEPVSPDPSAICSERDFMITLTARQPTFWVASHGRSSADGIPGLDPAPAIPPVSSSNFRGELLCVETDGSGNPQSGNSLIGTATLKHLISGDAAKYSAVGLQGFDTNNGDNVLCLGGLVTPACPNGAEYDGCPQYWHLDHYAEQAADDLAGVGSSINTELTIVPCTHDFEQQLIPGATALFRIENEFEQYLSATTTVTCWGNTILNGINPAFEVWALGSNHAQTRIGTPTSAPFTSGIIVVAHEFHRAAGVSFSASAAVDVHAEGLHGGGDVIVLPSFAP